MGRKSKELLKYELSTPEEKMVIQLERMNQNLDRLITTNITVSRDSEKLLRFIAEQEVKLLEVINTQQYWPDAHIKAVKKRLATL